MASKRNKKSSREDESVFLMTMMCSLVAATVGEVIETKGFDTPSITDAIQKAAPGDTVRLGEGTFELTEPVRPKSGIKLVGAGQDKTRLVYKGEKAGVLMSIEGCEDVEIAHITLDGQDNPLVHQGIGGSDSRRLWLHDLTVCNLKAKTWGPHGILFSGNNPTMKGGVTDSRITNCRIENIGLEAEYGGGIRLAWGCVRNQVTGNVVHNTGRGGIFGDHSPELIIRNNKVTGSGGEGLGIEIWGGCPRSLIEDNLVDHWLSVDQGHQSAVRRNVVGADDGSLKFLGIEIIAQNVVVTDNVVSRGSHIGLSVSNKPVKNNVYWGYNTVRDCAQWATQFQGETGGIARHYFHHCVFENTVRNHPKALYPQDSGHGFRTNGDCQSFVFEDCLFRNNGGYGVQFGGENIDSMDFFRSTISGNDQAVVGPSKYTTLEFNDCKVEGNKNDQLPPAKPFVGERPLADFQQAKSIRAGEPAQFQCTSPAAGGVVERLWDFGEGIPELTERPTHTFSQPGKYRVTLIVWNKNGRGGRSEKTVEVLPAK